MLELMLFGAALAFINADIMVTAPAIRCASFLIATVGILIGRIIGEKVGDRRG
jgi:manganese efflux pump family protein